MESKKIPSRLRWTQAKHLSIYLHDFKYFLHLCLHSEASQQYSAIPGGHPSRNTQSLPRSGEWPCSNPGLLLVTHLWTKSWPKCGWKHLSRKHRPNIMYKKNALSSFLVWLRCRPRREHIHKISYFRWLFRDGDDGRRARVRVGGGGGQLIMSKTYYVCPVS